MERIILHVDMDAFFASVEVMDNKILKGKPVIVGGVSQRGVVATCSYEARKYGVRSAMPGYMAKALCPMGIFLNPRFYRYKEISNRVFDILHSITSKVEAVSIDEAYLDITETNRTPLEVAKEIKYRVKGELGLTISVGISYNKFLAKLGSDWNKPDGLMIIKKDMVPKILFPLPINKVHGLGKKSVTRLNNIGIYNVEQLYKLEKEFLNEYFGKFGAEIYDRIRGEDKREVVTTRDRKSVGRETTLRIDTNDKEMLKEYLKEFSKNISTYLNDRNLGGKTITLKIKTSDFESHTKSKSFEYYLSNEEEIFGEGFKLLNSLELNKELRLIGLSISNLKTKEMEQLKFF